MSSGDGWDVSIQRRQGGPPVAGNSKSRASQYAFRMKWTVIASFSITPERKKVVDYSLPYGVIPVVVSAPKAMAIKSPADLVGKSIAVARGTTADIELSRTIKDAKVAANIVRYEDEATAVTALATGQQDLLAAALSTANTVAEQNPGKTLEVKLEMAAYPMAVGLRKNDPELKAYVDGWLQVITDPRLIDAALQSADPALLNSWATAFTDPRLADTLARLADDKLLVRWVEAGFYPPVFANLIGRNAQDNLLQRYVETLINPNTIAVGLKLSDPVVVEKWLNVAANPKLITALGKLGNPRLVNA